jgi:hypothetical protein
MNIEEITVTKIADSLHCYSGKCGNEKRITHTMSAVVNMGKGVRVKAELSNEDYEKIKDIILAKAKSIFNNHPLRKTVDL